MILDRRDIELLRIVGRYRWLPYEKVGRFGFGGTFDSEIDILSAAGLIKISRNREYMRLSQQGYKLLQMNGYDYGPGSNKPYSNASTLRRRLAVSEIILTALRAGIDVLRDNVEALANQPTFYPAFDLRDGETNLMSAANCAGFGHWGNNAYMLHYVSPESKGMFQTNELSVFHNLSSVFSTRLTEPKAMIFAGNSYIQIYKQVTSPLLSKRHGARSFTDFSEVYKQTELPIHLLSCDEDGARQLALMRQPEYNTRIAKAAFGDKWNPPDSLMPEADGTIDGNPLIIAADMDIRRVERVCALARSLSKPKIMLAAFRSQMENFYFKTLTMDGHIKPLSIEQPVLDAAFGKDFSLYSMDNSDEPERSGDDA